MMKTSRESGLDYSTHEAERGREKEEEGVSPHIDEEEAGGQIVEETKPGGSYPDKPEYLSGRDPFEPGPEIISRTHCPGKPDHISGGDPLETGAELVAGADCPGKTKLEIVRGEDPPETELEKESGEDGLGEPVSAEAPSSGVKPEAKDYPECLVAKTSQRSRPKLSRMERVQSSSSLSSEEEKIGRIQRLVLLKSKNTWS